jgi:hypothetical protein
LNLVFKNDWIRNKVDEDDFMAFIMAVTSNSFSLNNDGDGFYSDTGDILTKSEHKLNYLTHKKQIYGSNFLITHQRIATSGFEDRYTQPFQSKEFALAHNGVLSSFSNGNQSDTFVLFNKFCDAFKLDKGSRQEKVVACVKDLLDGASGSFSIALYDKVDKVMYYFKNSSTSIYCHRSLNNFIYMTTESSNDNFLNLLNIETTKDTVENYQIYAIKLVNEQFQVLKVGKIEEESFKVYNYGPYSSSSIYHASGSGYGRQDYYEELLGVKDFDDFEAKSDLEEELDWIKHELDFITAKKAKKCINCRVKTKNKNKYTKEYVCDDCIMVDKKNIEAMVGYYRDNKGKGGSHNGRDEFRPEEFREAE